MTVHHPLFSARELSQPGSKILASSISQTDDTSNEKHVTDCNDPQTTLVDVESVPTNEAITNTSTGTCRMDEQKPTNSGGALSKPWHQKKTVQNINAQPTKDKTSNETSSGSRIRIHVVKRKPRRCTRSGRTKTTNRHPVKLRCRLCLSQASEAWFYGRDMKRPVCDSCIVSRLPEDASRLPLRCSNCYTCQMNQFFTFIPDSQETTSARKQIPTQPSRQRLISIKTDAPLDVDFFYRCARCTVFFLRNKTDRLVSERMLMFALNEGVTQCLICKRIRAFLWRDWKASDTTFPDHLQMSKICGQCRVYVKATLALDTPYQEECIRCHATTSSQWYPCTMAMENATDELKKNVAGKCLCSDCRIYYLFRHINRLPSYNYPPKPPSDQENESPTSSATSVSTSLPQSPTHELQMPRPSKKKKPLSLPLKRKPRRRAKLEDIENASPLIPAEENEILMEKKSIVPDEKKKPTRSPNQKNTKGRRSVPTSERDLYLEKLIEGLDILRKTCNGREDLNVNSQLEERNETSLYVPSNPEAFELHELLRQYKQGKICGNCGCERSPVWSLNESQGKQMNLCKMCSAYLKRTGKSRPTTTTTVRKKKIPEQVMPRRCINCNTCLSLIFHMASAISSEPRDDGQARKASKNAGKTYRCNECHKFLKKWTTERPVSQEWIENTKTETPRKCFDCGAVDSYRWTATACEGNYRCGACSRRTKKKDIPPQSAPPPPPQHTPDMECVACGIQRDRHKYTNAWHEEESDKRVRCHDCFLYYKRCQRDRNPKLFQYYTWVGTICCKLCERLTWEGYHWYLHPEGGACCNSCSRRLGL